MVNKENHPKMALFQIRKLLKFAQTNMTTSRGIDSVIVNFGRIVAPSVFGSSLRAVQSFSS
jgi:hypothetical protein